MLAVAMQPALAEQPSCSQFAEHFSLIFSLKNKGVPLEKIVSLEHTIEEYIPVYEKIYNIEHYISKDTAYSKVYKNCLKNRKIIVM